MSALPNIKPLRIGPFELSTPAVLAPLAGYTDLPFRTICRRMGAEFCSTEVTLDTSINLSAKLRRKLIQINAEDHPLAAQIMGRHPETMAVAAQHVVAMGCDVVDLNFACPVRKVLRRRRGGHMMRDPNTGVRVIGAVREAVDVPLTVKLRRSFDEADRTNEAFWRMAEAAFDAGAVAICVHGRSVEARYAGPADWEFLTEVKRHFHDKTVIGSGDLLTAPHAIAMLEQTGVDGVSFARGALGNPWIFQQFEQCLAGKPPAEPPLTAQRAALREHYDLSIQQYGADRGARMMYRFGIRYASKHTNPKLLRQTFINSKEKDGLSFVAILERFYGDSEAAPN